MGDRLNLYTGAYYFIIAADINSYPELSLLKKRERIISDFQKEIKAFYKKSEIDPPREYLNPYKYIILWRNLQKTNIPNNTEDALFGAMCNSRVALDWNVLLQRGEDRIMPFLINVRNTDTFADGSIERFIKRYCMIKKYFSTQPLVYDLDMIPDSRKSFKQIQEAENHSASDDLISIDPDNQNLALEIINNAFADRYNKLNDFGDKYIENTSEERKQADAMISFMEKLYTTVTNDPIDYEICQFIGYYFMWQAGEISAESACQELGNMSKRTFYKYVSEFEAHPFYAEYEKIIGTPLWGSPKKGPLSVDLEQFYNDIIKIYPDGNFNMDFFKILQLGEIPDFTREYELCEKYSIPTVLDLCRTFLAVKKKLKR